LRADEGQNGKCRRPSGPDRNRPGSTGIETRIVRLQNQRAADAAHLRVGGKPALRAAKRSAVGLAHLRRNCEEPRDGALSRLAATASDMLREAVSF
jgi:hypothetical protein